MQKSSGPPERTPSVVEEYIRAQDFLHKRAIIVGRALQECRHYALEMVKFPVAAPYLTGLNISSVQVCIGVSVVGRLIAVDVPVGLFEHGVSGDIMDWVCACNQSHDEMVDAGKSKPSEADLLKRAGEMSILRELMAKYPEVATEG